MLLIILPVVLIIKLSLNFEMLETKNYKEKYSEFYKTLDLKKGRSVFLYPAFFIARRTILSGVLIYF